MREEDLAPKKNSDVALRLAKQGAEQARNLAQQTARQLLKIERAGKIGHWFMDEASQTMTWSAQMFELVGIPLKAALSTEEAYACVHPDDIAAFLAACQHATESRRRRG